ncbi:MAG: hypothetical protein KatS3mg010_0809 [Acidimicrobiia bacterium]|nr:MAG: hypothetical protein KatS3mg010_0809 [Acidimicrobiia bacterium]
MLREGATPVVVYGTVHDVTEQQEHIDEIVEREQLLRSVLDSIGALTAVLDGSGRVIAVTARGRPPRSPAVAVRTSASAPTTST